MRLCKLCAKPVNSVEGLARELVRLETDLSRVPAQGDSELRVDVLAYLAEEIRPRLHYVAAELFGVHYECRLDEAVKAGIAVEVDPSEHGPRGAA